MELFDVHTHKKPLAVANGYEIRYILNIYPEDFKNAEKDVDSLFSCGVHPWYSLNTESDLQLLTEIAQDKRVIAIGEAGLDKLQGPDLVIQTDVFRRQIELAMRTHKPIIIHCVKAWDELIALYKEYTTTIPWIIHGYRGKPEQAKQLAALGFKLSVGEMCSDETIKSIPSDSLFCETDTSVISIYGVYQRVAEVLNITVDKLSTIIAHNVKCTFR
ncbi:TatD family hydrolase [Dysgonomonas sp. ZJ279]|uniref:TatD family hydrolase n=1 Tax=Dysgonomonas sp. ZJ279 TaxID=2709796 RepID=UPI0013EE1417|nr:TatD family hydrolase [Dysgonomonas sp. ZJ279]